MVMAGALPEIVHATLQIHDDSTPTQQFPIGLTQRCATASGEHNIAALENFLQSARFPLPETRLALDIENMRNGDTGVPLYFLIAIDKGFMQLLGYQSANGCLAGSHEANQDDVTGV